MFCKYCNADLKPEDKICPVCEKPVNEIENTTNLNVVNDMDNIPQNIMEGLDKSIFEPLQPQESKVEESISVEEGPIIVEEPTIEQDNNYIENQQQPQIENIPSNNQNGKHENHMWMSPIIVFVFVIVMSVLSFFVLRSPKMVFNQLINKGYKQINNSMITDARNMKGMIALQTNISSQEESSNGIFEILNNIYLSANYEIDYENENALLKLNTKYDNEKLLDADIYIKDTKGYILLKDVYDKYLSIGIGDSSSLFEKAEITDDHKVVMSEVKKTIIKSLKSEYFTREKEDIKIGDKNKVAYKNSLVLTNEVINKIERDFLTYLKENNKFIDSLSDVVETNETEIISSIEEKIKILDSNTVESSDTKIIASIYTNLINEVVKIQLEIINGTEKMIFEVIQESENNYRIILNGSGMTINGNLKILENNKNNTKIEFSITEPTTGTIIGFTVDSSVKYNQKLTNIDVSNSIDVNNLTEEEVNTITTKLMENKGIQNLISAFEGLMGNDQIYEEEIILGDGVELIY